MQPAEISGAQPPVDERRSGRRRVVEIAQHHLRRPDEDLPHHPLGDLDAPIVDDPQFDAGRGHARRGEQSRFVPQAPAMQGSIEEHRVAGQLRHPVALREIDPQEFVGPPQQRRRHRCSAVRDGSE